MQIYNQLYLIILEKIFILLFLLFLAMEAILDSWPDPIL